MDDHADGVDEREDTVTPEGMWFDPSEVPAGSPRPCSWLGRDVETSPPLPAQVEMSMNLLHDRLRQCVAEALAEVHRG